MKFTSTLALALLAGASLATPAMAECVYPKTPASPPNGNTATKEEMLAARDAVTQYNADVDKYLGCLDEEATKNTQDTSDEAERKKIKAIADKKHDAAVEELRARADEFNQQLHVFNAKHKS